MDTKKAKKYFRIESFNKDTKELHIVFKLEAPSPENRSKGTKTVVGGKETALRDGKTYVIGRAFGSLPYHIKGRPIKINASIMVPIQDNEKASVEEVSL